MRFICGLFTPHLELERDLAGFLGTERAISYVSCWNANQALLDTLCDKRTWILSDELNHASIIDGIRLARPAGKAVYAHADPAALERELAAVPEGHRCLVVTDGVFSMEGDLAPLPEIVELTESHGATLIVDDSHGLGVLGPTGRGTAEHFGARRPRRHRHRHARQGARRRGGRVRRRQRRALRAARAALARPALLQRAAANRSPAGPAPRSASSARIRPASAGCTRTSSGSAPGSRPPACGRSRARARSSRSSSARPATRSR